MASFTNHHVTSAWRAEIHRRAQQLTDGTVHPITLDEMRQRVEKCLLQPPSSRAETKKAEVKAPNNQSKSTFT